MKFRRSKLFKLRLYVVREEEIVHVSMLCTARSRNAYARWRNNGNVQEKATQQNIEGNQRHNNNAEKR